MADKMEQSLNALRICPECLLKVQVRDGQEDGGMFMCNVCLDVVSADDMPVECNPKKGMKHKKKQDKTQKGMKRMQ